MCFVIKKKSALSSVMNEKKVEIFHSRLRSKIRKTDRGDFNCSKINDFTQKYMYSFSSIKKNILHITLQSNITLKGLASEGILGIFERVALNLGKSYMLPRPVNRAGLPLEKQNTIWKVFWKNCAPSHYLWGIDGLLPSHGLF